MAEKAGFRMKKKRTRVDPFAMAAVLILLLILAGFASGRDDSEKDDQEYCRMVAEKRWPDYRGSYHRDCQPNQTPSNPR